MPSCGGCVVFDGGPKFPPHPDSCVSSKQLELDDLTLTSIGGDGTTWLCASSRRYGLTTEHVALEAGVNAPAEIEFRAPVLKVSFDYVAWDGLSLEITADRAPLRKLSADHYEKGSLQLEFAGPTTVLGFVSDDNFSHTIAIDNLIYESDPSTCQ
jgi:hypothetical protein